MFSNRAGMVNYLQLLPFIQEIESHKTNHIPRNKIINLAKIIRQQPNKNKRSIMISIYDKQKGNIPANALVNMTNSVYTMRTKMINDMSKYENGKFKNYLLKFSPIDVNTNNKISNRAEKTLRPLWNISRNKRRQSLK